MDSGTWGPLRSVDPPITVPAWSCMMTGHDPGELGIYGFRNRTDHGYDSLSVADSRSVRLDRVWDVLGRAGRHVVVVGVPQTSPPVRGQRRARVVLPDLRPADGRLHPSRRAAHGDRRPRRLLPRRRAELPQRRSRSDPGRDLRDDRAALPGLPPSARHEAVGLLHDGRDRARPDAPRVLALLRRGAPPPRARPSLQRRDPQLLRLPRRGDRRAAWRDSTRTPRCSSSPITARVRWRARSA